MIQVENDIVSVIGDDGSVSKHTIGSPEAFSILSKIWLRSGWDTKYVYSFTWLGRPIIQLPEDLMRLQEVAILNEQAELAASDRVRSMHELTAENCCEFSLSNYGSAGKSEQ